MDWTTGVVISLISLLSGGVTAWVVMNTKVTRLETKVETLDRDIQALKSDWALRMKEVRDEMHELAIDIRKILVKLGVDK